MNDSDSFFGSAKSAEDSASRPRAVNPKTGQVQDWQRASNYAAPLDNPHGLIKWKMRELIKGISLRPDLARMLLTGAAIEDNAKADEIIATAHAAVAIDAKANEGTAVHAALSRSFLGQQVQPEYSQHVQAFAAELQRNGLTPVATELTLLNTTLDGLGHVDWVVRTADGRHLVLDVKTGKLGDAKRKFAVQCKVYAGADYALRLSPANSPEPIPFTIDQTEAILAHVDPHTGATALYRVDLVLGFYGATLAERVRDWHKIEVLSPYTPVHPSIPVTGAQVVGTPVVSEPRPASVQQAIGSQAELAAAAHVVAPDGTLIKDRNGVDFVCRFDGKAASAHPITTPGAFQCSTPEPKNDVTGHTCTYVGDPSCPECAKQVAALPVTNQPGPIAHGQALNATIEDELTELLQAKNTKPVLQQVAKGLGLSDLAHDRKWLALWIIATRRGADNPSATLFAKSKGTKGFGGAASFSATPVDTEPSAEQDVSFLFKSIAGASSEGALVALMNNVISRKGDQAWTDELAEAARLRSMELRAVSPVNPHAHVLAAIAAATEPQHIALMWSETTLGGSAPENWTPEFKKAADDRLAVIHQNQGAPPANPYGPQQ